MKKTISLLLASTIVLASCSKGDTREDKSVLKVGMGADVASFDLHGKNDSPSSRVRTNIYEGLVEQDAQLNIIPLLAQSWTTDDSGTVWTFNLRKGVKFHTGDEFTAEDVEFTFNRAKESSNVGHLLETIAEINVIDDYTVELVLEFPYMPLLNNLSHTTMGMLSKKVVEEQGEDYASTSDGNNPIGTGPFKFEDFVQGQGTTLVKNENYWNKEKEAKVDKIEMYTYTDNSSRKLALDGGDVDIAYDIAAPDYQSVKNNNDLQTFEDYDLSYAYGGFNMENPKFADKRVREAINLAINIESMVAAPTILNGLGKEANSPISMRTFGWSENVKAYGYDPDKARELLKEAGVEDLEITIWTNENATRVQAATVIQAQLAEVGIKVKVEKMEWGAYLDKTAKGEHEIFILGWTSVTADADYGLYPLFHSSAVGAAGNRTFYRNDDLDKLLEDGRSASSAEERLEIYEKAQQHIMDENIHIPFWNTLRVHAAAKDVTGFVAHPSGSMKLNTVSFE